MLRKYNVILFFTFITKLNHVYSQGCSDAGFCTSENFKPELNQSDTSETVLKNSFKAGFSMGKADNSINILAGALEYSRVVGKKIKLNAKLTGISQSGSAHTSMGISDFYFNGTYSLNKQLNTTIGLKIPLSDGNNKKGDVILPMDYQTSLGTFDLIAGVAYSIKKLKLVFAIQQPLTQNKNTFLQTEHDSTSVFLNFSSTNQYIRQGDILLRIAYSIPLGKKINITPSILPIYHLGNDSYTNSLGQKEIIIGSEGLTLNGNIFFEYHINKKNAIELSFGTPFITRKSRPDGLTRKYVLGIEYKISF